MIGNAVPVRLAYYEAKSIKESLCNLNGFSNEKAAEDSLIAI